MIANLEYKKRFPEVKFGENHGTHFGIRIFLDMMYNNNIKLAKATKRMMYIVSNIYVIIFMILKV